MNTVNWDQIAVAFNETIYMTFVSLACSVIFGLIIGIFLYCTSSKGLFKNLFINRIIDVIINVLRAIPFILLMIILVDFTKAIVGTMLGATAALPSLIASGTPFFARMVVISFFEVDEGTIEASKAMGASNWTIITKVLLKESMPSLISSITVTGISLVGYTAMAGAIGAGGLGNLAYLYGFARRNNTVLTISTVLIILIVFAMQWLGDFIVKKIDRR